MEITKAGHEQGMEDQHDRLRGRRGEVVAVTVGQVVGEVERREGEEAGGGTVDRVLAAEAGIQPGLDQHPARSRCSGSQRSYDEPVDLDVETKSGEATERSAHHRDATPG